MKTRLLSALLIFLLVASVSVPTVSAETPQVYYELHNMCLCNAEEDLGKILFATFGIGYSARVIDSQNDKWEIFIHAGSAIKKFTITSKTDTSTLVTLRDFVNNVDDCRAEIDQIPDNAVDALFTGGSGSVLTVGGALYDNAPTVVTGLVSLGYSAKKIEEITKNFNNAKRAQKNAEKLFDEL